MEPPNSLRPALSRAPSAEPARWLVEGIKGFAVNVGSVVPHGFQAYARVFQPARTGETDGRAVTWGEIAASMDRVLHPEAQWPNIAFSHEITNINELQRPPAGAIWSSAPEEGELDPEVARALAEVLGAYTTTDKCWFGVWEGWGGLRQDIRQAPAFELPARRYFLLEGPIEAINETVSQDTFYRSASLWWPDDRPWFVAIDVDLESAYVGGTNACIEALVSHPDLEVLRVEVTHGVTWDADTVNPNPLRLSN